MAKDKNEGGSGRPSKEYSVGYKRPPVEHRFKGGGPCPNRFGRGGKPKGVANGEEPGFLDEKVWITENGKRIQITRDKYIDLKLFNGMGDDPVKASRRLDERDEIRRRREAARRDAQSIAQAALVQDESADEAIISKALARRAKKGEAIGKVEGPDE